MVPIIFLLVAVASALAWHRWCARRWWAVLGATATTVVVFQALAWLHLGHWGPFALIAAAMTLVPAALVAVLVGLLPLRRASRS